MLSRDADLMQICIKMQQHCRLPAIGAYFKNVPVTSPCGLELREGAFKYVLHVATL